jgi:hypothetical protein
MVDQYAREVEDFRFIPLNDESRGKGHKQDDRRLRVTIGINGWLSSNDDITKPWRCLGDDSEAFALRYETRSLMGLGKSLEELVSSYAWNTVKVEILKRTVLATLWSALWPAYLLSMASTVDNPFSLARNRSEKAGEILADALINKVQGERPVTLIGYSLGSRVIYSCLRSLAKRHAFGLIDTVIFIGSPVPSNRQHWEMMRTVVSGKMYNVYSKNDYLLAFLYRATSIQLGVAGLQEIKDVEGVENLNLSEEVQGHMRYARIIGNILARCGLPVTQGADAPIGKDEDAIRLDDLDENNPEPGTLIELDSLNISEPPPPGYSPAPPATRRRQDARRTTVVRGAPSSLSVSQDPLGVALSDPLSTSTSNTVAPKPAATTSSQSPSRRAERQLTIPNFEPLENPNTKFRIADGAEKARLVDRTPNLATSATPPPTLPSPSHIRQVVGRDGNDRDEDDDDDEEGGFGIKMVDNDDLDYVEPTPIDD